ncbi:SRPBCC family protein [Sphingomicrobium clamense]|uniref:SRPBCC family protein n=1 Tax=Sphingomicrobium clamense TaxID=2851013 RepID=A0ABS6V482_9SPHN|nr:SRPBCC family protein [Sphingomicrobium sp. B8]MBW0144360.1 SRPBCC family protein [Sphingomicrobium sp. B8]
MQKTLSHRFTLDLPPKEAFPLFTAEGERAWVEGWNPTFLHAERPETTAKGTVWQTGEGGTRTLWMCMDWEPPRSVRYARVMPAASFDVVEVTVEPDGEGSAVTVAYTFTPLTNAARAEVDAIDQEKFAAMIGEWPTLIARAT